MYPNIIFLILNIIFFYYIIKNIKFFGIKESFLLGMTFYTIFPFSLYVFFENFLLINFPKFNGFNLIEITIFQFVYILMISSFLFGYYFNNNNSIKLKILKINFSKIEIIIALFILLIFLNFNTPNLNPVILILILLFLLNSKLRLKTYQKTLMIIFLAITLQFLSSYLSGARRDIIKIFLISLFFLSINLKQEKKQLIFFFTLFLTSIIFIFYTTYLRTDWDFFITFKTFVFSSSRALIQNYDFMPAFDNLIYILNNDDFLYGQSLFKIFFSWIPRGIWIFKPEDTHTLITLLRENSFVGGHAAAVTFLGETFWNFGYFGVLIIFFGIGYITKSFDLTIKNKLSDIELILASSMTYLFFLFWRGSVSTTLLIYIINIISILLLLMSIKIIIKLINEKKN